MVNLGVIPLASTARFYFSTAAADGGEEAFSATLEEADVVVMKDGAAMTLTAGTITITSIATGIYEIDIDQTNDADFTAGSTYWVYVDPDTETIDAQAVSGVLGLWSTETASQFAARQYQEKVYPGHVVSTTTGNSATAVNLTEIIDANTGADVLIGEVLAIWDATDGVVYLARVTDFAVTNLLATIEALNSAVTLPTVAAGDMIWRVGQYTSDVWLVRNASAANLATAIDNYSAERGLAGTALPDAAADGAGGLPVSDAGGLDLDAKIGALTFTVANVLDANTRRIAGVVVIGAGTSGDKWRA